MLVKLAGKFDNYVHCKQQNIQYQGFAGGSWGVKGTEFIEGFV